MAQVSLLHTISKGLPAQRKNVSRTRPAANISEGVVRFQKRAARPQQQERFCEHEERKRNGRTHRIVTN
jgi:hypothetical protein